MEFNLRIQEFIELSKKDKKVEAIVHARKYLTSSQNDAKKNTEEEPVSLTPEQTNMVKKVMASLVFGPSTPIPGYKELYEDSRWNELIEQFKADNYQVCCDTIFGERFICCHCNFWNNPMIDVTPNFTVDNMIPILLIL